VKVEAVLHWVKNSLPESLYWQGSPVRDGQIFIWKRVEGVGCPLHGGGLPGIFGGLGGTAKGEDEIDEEGDLCADEEDGRHGDVALERHGGLKEGRGRAGDASELGVVAGFSGEAGEVHGEEGGVGTEEGGPEVELAEGFGEGAVEEEGSPVSRSRR